MDEAQIVREARQNPAAFGRIYDHYFQRIFNYVFHKVDSREMAEDVTARTFTQALAKIDQYEWRGFSFGAWLYQIARNEIGMYRRRNWWRCPIEWLTAAQIAVQSQVEPDLVHQERLQALHTALAQLPKRYRDVLELRYLEELSAEDVAHLTGETRQNVYVLTSRALTKLRTQLDRMEAQGIPHVSLSLEIN